jgi:hypothetical protein
MQTPLDSLYEGLDIFAVGMPLFERAETSFETARENREDGGVHGESVAGGWGAEEEFVEDLKDDRERGVGLKGGVGRQVC